MEPISDIQRKIYDAIVRCIQTEEIPPTNREIGQTLGISSTGYIEHHLRALTRKGWITRLPGKGRGIKLIQSVTGIPLKGTIAAGQPLDIYPVALDHLQVVESPFQQKNTIYALAVRGSSMIEDHICDGDYVVIESEAPCQNGDIVVATHLQEGGEHGSATLKRWFQETDGVRLQPANAEMEPLRIPKNTWDREWKVQGKVIAILRRCSSITQAMKS